MIEKLQTLMSTNKNPDDDYEYISTVTIGGAGAGGTGGSGYTTLNTTLNWNGTSTSTWNTTCGTISASSVTINANGAVGSGSGYYGGTYTTYSSQPTITVATENNQPLLKTQNNTINLDELAEMIILMKQLLTAVASDEEFAKRNPALADSAYDMLLKKLKD